MMGADLTHRLSVRTEQCGVGRYRYWAVRDSYNTCIGIVEPREGEQVQAYRAGRPIGRYPDLSAAAQALIAAEVLERAGR